jgi:hypothetical protein
MNDDERTPTMTPDPHDRLGHSIGDARKRELEKAATEATPQEQPTDPVGTEIVALIADALARYDGLDHHYAEAYRKPAQAVYAAFTDSFGQPEIEPDPGNFFGTSGMLRLVFPFQDVGE